MYWEPVQTSGMKFVAKVNDDWQSLAVFAEIFILDVAIGIGIGIGMFYFMLTES